MSRHGIGGNNPPPDAAFALHIDGLFSLLSDSLAGGTVASDEQEAAIDAILDDFRAASKDADKARTAEKKPHDDAGKAVQAAWKPLLDRCDKVGDALAIGMAVRSHTVVWKLSSASSRPCAISSAAARVISASSTCFFRYARPIALLYSGSVR